MSYIVELTAKNIDELRDILDLIFANDVAHYLSDIKREKQNE